MKQLILLRGLPGCGKTTLANFLWEKIEDCARFSADDFFTDEEGSYKFNVNCLGAAHMACKDNVLNSMKRHVEVIIVHNTNTTQGEMKDYFLLAHEYGYQTVSLIVENRHNSTNIHSVPEETLIKMKGRFDVRLI